MPRYAHQTRGPQNNIIWTTVIYSGFLSLYIFVVIDLICKFEVDNIEYGRGEGRSRDAASDAAAIQALAQMRNEYGQ